MCAHTHTHTRTHGRTEAKSICCFCHFTVRLDRISAPALAESQQFLQIQPKSGTGQNVAGFRFFGWICKMVHKILFQLLSKNCAVMLPYFLLICLLCWDLTLWILTSLSSFANKSQIRFRPQLWLWPDLCRLIQLRSDLHNLNPAQPYFTGMQGNTPN